MTQESGVIVQLNSIIGALEQEQAGIAVIARPLTDLEMHRLDQIADALPLLKAAVERLMSTLGFSRKA